MNLNKHIDFFNPITVEEEIHVLGCGAIGSNVATQLIRLGIQNLHIWDFDTVTEHNVTNQIYTEEHIDKLKTECLKNHLLSINKNATIKVHGKYEDHPLKGYVFMCMDKMTARNQFIDFQQYNAAIKLSIDTRMGLDLGQIYCTPWKKEHIANFKIASDFKDEDVEAPVSACGTTLSVSPTVLTLTAIAISSFINFTKGLKIPFYTIINPFDYKILSSDKI